MKKGTPTFHRFGMLFVGTKSVLSSADDITISLESRKYLRTLKLNRIYPNANPKITPHIKALNNYKILAPDRSGDTTILS